ncbi:MAG: hypothetical protein MUC92_05355 [Fimbriimonadaceae bacterium]|jgi:HEAT repeat protein|nr:hypothetical protein [Fimbriimonadaceae bacterium]
MAWCRKVVGLLVLVATSFAGAQLTQGEKQGVQDSLFIGNMTVGDLLFNRVVHSDPWRMTLVQRSLQDPLTSADEVMLLHQSSRLGKVSDVILRASRIVSPDIEMGSATVRTPVVLQGNLPSRLRPIVVNLATAMATADREISIALSSLNLAERREIFDGLPTLALEENSIPLTFVERRSGTRERILALLRRVDRDRILAAGFFLNLAAENAIQELQASQIPFDGKVTVVAEGIRCVIAGRGSDLHNDPEARLILDLGGNDTYLGRAGAGRGNSGLMIDLGGDDRFLGEDLTLGAGLLGVGICHVIGGNDEIKTGSAALGWGVGGLGVWIKEGGLDHYSSRAMAQGFGMFGVGICLDTEGDDFYRLAYFGQGAGRTLGVGWLIDRAGNDIYRAGGLILNSPLFADVHYSFAQGMGMGFREDSGGVSGGVGLLTDWSGDDAYLGETYCQAASYWYSLGSLFDQAGNDSYSAHHYAQSSAMHLCSAFLFDLAGSDSYTIKVGAGHAIGHDYGVAFFLDRAGNDVYAARDSNPAIGTANGLALFIDSGGDDRYNGPPGQGNPARGTGSLGVFVDLSGSDLYAAGIADAQASAGSRWGSALDIPPPLVVNRTTESASRPAAVPGSKAAPQEAVLEELYRKATRWGVGTAQAEVAESIDELIRIGMPAWDFMVSRKLSGADRLQIRAFGAVGRALAPGSAEILATRLATANDQDLKQILRVANEANLRQLGPSLAPLLESRQSVRLDLVRACGTLEVRESVPFLMRLLLNEDLNLVRAAMISLEQINDPSSASTAQVMVTHPDLLTRKAALTLLARFPQQGRSAALDLLRSSDERRVRLGLELLAQMGPADLAALVLPFLTDARPGVRLSALQALDGRIPPASRPQVDALRQDPSPLVRAVAGRIR